MPYDPANFDAFFAHEYGGYGGGHHMSAAGGGGGGRFPPGMTDGANRGGGGRAAAGGVVRGRVPMPPGGFGRPMYGSHHHHQDGFMQPIGFPGNRPPMGQGFGGHPRGDQGFGGHPGGGRGGKYADQGRFMGGHGGGAPVAPVGFDIDEETTQVTIPKEVAGAIIGKKREHNQNNTSKYHLCKRFMNLGVSSIYCLQFGCYIDYFNKM